MVNQEGISIGTISGGIVNFGGAGCIAPITITSTTSGSGTSNSGTDVTSSTGLSSTTTRTISNILNLLQSRLKDK